MPLSAVDPEAIGGYRLLDRLGAGGMGVVYLGASASGRQVAVKVVHAQFAENEEFRTRFRREVAAVRRVSGAFTASVVDADPEAALPWMATLYVPGPTLAQWVGEQGPLPLAQVRRLALGLVEALGDIHRVDVVHRDLKPANVLMAQDGPRVIDFGISRAVDDDSFTMTGRVMGTPPFMSPEALSRPREVTAASDVFSLGALLVYASTGRGPFDGESPYVTMYQVVHERPVLGGVPRPLRRIVERCLAKEQLARPGLPELTRLFEELPEDALSPAEDPDTAADPTTATDAPASPGPAAFLLTRPLRTFRSWSLLARAAALGMVALGSCALVLAGTVGGEHPTATGTGRPAPAGASAGPPPQAREAALPTGWRPWKLTLSGGHGESGEAAIANCRPYEGALYCYGDGFHAARINAASGHLDWRVPASRSGEPIAIEARAGLVLVRGSQLPDDSSRADLTVLNAASGKKIWTKRVANLNAAFFGRAVLSSGASEGGSLDARDAATGAQLWSTPWPSGFPMDCEAQVFDDVPYAACSGDPEEGTILLRLNPRNGSAKKMAKVKDVANPVGLHGNDLVMLSTDGASTDGSTALLRVDVRTGDRRTVTLPTHPVGDMALAAGVLFFVQDTGRITAVDPDTGKQLWSTDTGVDLLGAPAASEAENTVYLSSLSGRLVALDLRTGRERWQTAAMGTDAFGTQPQPPPIRAGGSIVTLASGGLRSLDPLHPDSGRRPTAPAPANSAPASAVSFRREAAGPVRGAGRGVVPRL